MEGRIKQIGYWLAGAIALGLVYLWMELKRLRFEVLEIRIKQSTLRPQVYVKAALYNPLWFTVPVKVRKLDVYRGDARLFTGNRNMRLRLAGHTYNPLEFSAVYTNEGISWQDVALLLDHRKELYVQAQLEVFGFNYVLQRDLVTE
ncbi:MAG: hypothetical protein RLP14_05885 [Owenweeksia sp.]